MDPFNTDEEPTSRKAEFARFHGDNYPTLVALLHALDGDRAHAHKVAQRAFTHTWRRWDTVRALPDPAAWIRGRARQAKPPRRKRATAGQNRSPNDTEWIAPVALPTFEALAALPVGQRRVLALHHVAGLDHAHIAEEEGLKPDVVEAELAQAYEALATQLGHNQPDIGAVHTWAARQLDDLTHALSYGSDRRATEQVFHRAVRQRLTVATAAVAALSIVGVGGTFAVTQYETGAPRAILPPSGGPGALVMPPPDVERAPETPLLPPGAPAGTPAVSRSAITPDADLVPNLDSSGRESDSDDDDSDRSDDRSDSNRSSDRSDRSFDRFSVPRPVAAAPRSAATPNATQAQPNANQPATPAQGTHQQPVTQPRTAQNSPNASGTSPRSASRDDDTPSTSRSDRGGNGHADGRSDNDGNGDNGGGRSSWGSDHGGG